MEIEYTDGAMVDLGRIPQQHADQITRKVERLRHGLVGDIKALTNADAGYRLRSGNYRVLFDCDGKIVVVRAVKNRRDAYRYITRPPPARRPAPSRRAQARRHS